MIRNTRQTHPQNRIVVHKKGIVSLWSSSGSFLRLSSYTNAVLFQLGLQPLDIGKGFKKLFLIRTA